MRRDRSDRDPLLYIHQSNKKTPEAYMQQDYATPDKKYSDVEIEGNYRTSNSNRSKIRRIKRSSYFKSPHLKDEHAEEHVTADADNKDSELSERSGHGETSRRPRGKSFKEMTLEEKVYYFAHAPTISPVLRCEVRTSERSFRGRIVDYIDNEVYMRIGRRKSPEKIPFDTIRDIRLLGF